MGKDYFLTDYTNKKGEKKYSIGVSKDFLSSIYNLDTNSFEEMFDSFSEHINEDEESPNDQKIQEFTNFLKTYFSL